MRSPTPALVILSTLVGLQACSDDSSPDEGVGTDSDVGSDGSGSGSGDVGGTSGGGSGGSGGGSSSSEGGETDSGSGSGGGTTASGSGGTTSDSQGGTGGTDTGDPGGGENPPGTTHLTTIQPIQTREDDGSNPINPDQELREAALEKTWAQAGTAFEILPWVTWDNSEVRANAMGYGLDRAVQDAPLHEDPSVVNVVFVAYIDGGGGTGGIAQTPGRVAFIAEWVLDPGQPLHVIPHEIGHTYGLGHTDYDATADTFPNLMYNSGPGSLDDIFPDGAGHGHLTESQLMRVEDSPLRRALMGAEPGERVAETKLPAWTRN